MLSITASGELSSLCFLSPKDLEEFLLGRGLSLSGHGIITPPHAGMSLAAVLETASHGSSLVGPASIASGLRTAVLVDGSGERLQDRIYKQTNAMIIVIPSIPITQARFRLWTHPVNCLKAR